MEGFLVELLVTSVIAGLLVLLVMALSPFFKNRYSMGLKQLLWLLLAMRLLIPVSFGDTWFTFEENEYENGIRVYEDHTIQDEELGQEQPAKRVYLTLPNGIPANDAFNELMISAIYERTSEKTQYNGDVLSVVKGSYTGAPVAVKDETWQEKAKTLAFQCIHVLIVWSKPIAAVYVLGVALFVLVYAAAYLFYIYRTKKVRKEVEKEEMLCVLDAVAKRIGIKRVPKLYQMEGLASPMAVGFIRFAVYLPPESYTEKELSAIFSHELTHIRHQDLRIKVLYLLANAVHWFNPLIYVMRRRAGHDMELYCDQTVVELYGREEREEYNELLLHILKNHARKVRTHYFSTCFRGGMKEMKERFLENLDMRSKKEGIFPTILVAVLIALSAGLFSVESRMLPAGSRKTNDWLGAWVQEISDRKASSLASATQNSQQVGVVEGAEALRESDAFINSHVYRSDDQTVLQAMPSKQADGSYRVPWHVMDGTDYIMEQTEIFSSEEEALKAPPQVQVYCGQTPIPSYGTDLAGWDGKFAVEDNQARGAQFFAEQCAKGEENPLVYVNDGMVDELIYLFFPQGQEPDLAEVQDTLLDADGSPFYEGEPTEMFFEEASVDDLLSCVTFGLMEYPAISYENEVGVELPQAVRPYYRGYRIKCYWAGRDILQSCTYYIVVRTQTASHGEAVQ